jgi:hypothetical protein
MRRKRKHKKHANKSPRTKEEPANTYNQQNGIGFRDAIAHALSRGWVQNCGTGVLFVFIGLIVAVILKVGVKGAAITFALAGTAFVWLVAAIIIRAVDRPENPPFSVVRETAFVWEKRDSAQIFAQYNNRYITPVPISIFFRIVNNQDIPAKVSHFKVEIELEKRRWLPDKWIEPSLVREHMPLVWVNTPPTPPRRLLLVGPYLMTALEKPIPPHETVWGWMLFDVPKEYDSGIRPTVFRVSVRDTAGHTYTAITPQSSDNIADPPRGWDTRDEVDITGFTLRHFGGS